MIINSSENLRFADEGQLHTVDLKSIREAFAQSVKKILARMWEVPMLSNDFVNVIWKNAFHGLFKQTWIVVSPNLNFDVNRNFDNHKFYIIYRPDRKSVV